MTWLLFARVFGLVLLLTASAYAITPVPPPGTLGADVTPPAPNPLPGALPVVYGLNADFLDDVSSEDFFDAIAAERDARITADEVLRSDLAAEATTREAADMALHGALAAEATTREAADAALRVDLGNEAAARQVGDDALHNDVASEAAARRAADEAEQAARAAADAGLGARLDNLPKQRIERYYSDATTNGQTQLVASYAPQAGSAFLVTSYFLTVYGGPYYCQSSVASIRFVLSDGSNVTHTTSAYGNGYSAVVATPTGMTTQGFGGYASIGENTVFPATSGKSIVRIEFLKNLVSCGAVAMSFSAAQA